MPTPLLLACPYRQWVSANTTESYEKGVKKKFHSKSKSKVFQVSMREERACLLVPSSKTNYRCQWQYRLYSKWVSGRPSSRLYCLRTSRWIGSTAEGAALLEIYLIQVISSVIHRSAFYLMPTFSPNYIVVCKSLLEPNPQSG